MNKKAFEMSLRELISLIILALFLIGLFFSPIPSMMWNFITQKPNIAIQDKFDRLITEINSLNDGDSTVVPFDINKDADYILRSVRQCKSGEDPTSDLCTKKEPKLCLIDEEKENAKPFCKTIDNGYFLETNMLDILAQGNVKIEKDSNGFITISDASSEST